MIEAKGLTKVFQNRPALKPWLDWVVSKNRYTPGDAKALDWLNFKVRAGEVLGVVGPAGSGKSALLKIVAMIDKPTSGSVKIGEHDAANPPKKRWRFVGYMPDKPPLFGGDELGEHLARLAAALEYPKGMWRDKAVNGALETVGLLAKKYDEISTLSPVERQWLGLAKAIMGEERVAIVLDEPFAYLGPREAARMGALLRKLASQGKAVIAASRSVHELAACCDRLALLEDGKFAVVGDPKSVLEKLRAPDPAPVEVSAPPSAASPSGE